MALTDLGLGWLFAMGRAGANEGAAAVAGGRRRRVGWWCWCIDFHCRGIRKVCWECPTEQRWKRTNQLCQQHIPCKKIQDGSGNHRTAMTAATRRTWTAWRRPWTDAIPAVVAALAVSSVLALDEEGGSGSYETHYADQGSNTTLHCLGQSGPSGVLWTHHRYFFAICRFTIRSSLPYFFAYLYIIIQNSAQERPRG